MRLKEGGGWNNNNMDDFYHFDIDKGFIVETDLSDEITSKLDASIYLKVSAILFVRAGLFLSQVSSIPSSNIQILIFTNIIDIAVNTVIYSLLGFLFAFGKDSGSFIGVDGFLEDNTDRNQFIEGWLIVIGASGLLVAAIGDRISFFASLILNIVISGIVFPIFIHWILSDSGWMRVHEFLGVHVSYKDYSYSCLIHMAGGFLAFVSMLILNKRLLRFKDMDASSIPDNGPSLTLFGNFFTMIGFFSIGVPTEKYILSHLNYNFYGIVLTNTLLSAFGAVTLTLLLTFSCPCEPMHKWTSVRSIQAAVSGIAAVAGGADVYHPFASLTVGISNGIIFFVISYLINKSSIEDYSNIIACHFVSGFFGTLLPPLLGIREGFNTTAYNAVMHCFWQLICDFAILSVIVIVFGPIFLLLDYCSILRSWDEDINHRRAIFASQRLKDQGENGMVQQQQPQLAVNYLETDYQSQIPQNETLESTSENPPENLDVLFEKRNSEPEIVPKENEPWNFDNFQKTIPKSILYEGALNFDNDQYIMNYVMNSKPMTFFEELHSDSRETLETKIKNCGDWRNSKFFDVKLMKGIRNISDSKLLNKLKDPHVSPKKRTVWNREHELRFGSVSNIRVCNTVKVAVETEV